MPSGQRSEGIIGRGKDRQRTFTIQRINQTSGLHSGNQRRETPVRGSNLDNGARCDGQGHDIPAGRSQRGKDPTHLTLVLNLDPVTSFVAGRRFGARTTEEGPNDTAIQTRTTAEIEVVGAGVGDREGGQKHSIDHVDHAIGSLDVSNDDLHRVIQEDLSVLDFDGHIQAIGVVTEGSVTTSAAMALPATTW